MNAPLVLVTSRSFLTGTDDLIGRLNQAGARVVRGAIDHDLKSIRPELESAVAWIAGTSPVTAQHLAAAPKLRLIARYGVGVDAVDRDAAARAGVTVTNNLGANRDAVAEHALALLFAALRRIVSGDKNVRAQDWTVLRTKEMRNVQVGIVGSSSSFPANSCTKAAASDVGTSTSSTTLRRLLTNLGGGPLSMDRRRCGSAERYP